MAKSKIKIEGEKWGRERVRADRTDELYAHIPEGETLMKIDKLRIVYRTDDKETVAVDDFTIDIKKGELVSIIGPSGCGTHTSRR